jgi:hypothetical protein
MMSVEVDSKHATYSLTVFRHDAAVLQEPREVVQVYIPGIPLPLHAKKKSVDAGVRWSRFNE